MSGNTYVSKNYRTFSGTDTLAFALLPSSKPVILGSMTTISYSSFRSKSPVHTLGRINVSGVTRGTRVYAGTMIFTMINQHWVEELVDEVGWLKNYKPLKTDELPIFDIMIVCANEFGASVQMFIYGVDITDEGQVISIEDLLTENQISFIARDIDTFKEFPETNNRFSVSRVITSIKDFDVVDNLTYRKSNVKDYSAEPIELLRHFSKEADTSVYGTDVIAVQNYLTMAGYPVNITGVFDTQTFNAVSGFQNDYNLPVTGAIDDDTYLSLKDEVGLSIEDTAIIVSKSGSNIYSEPKATSNVVGVLDYLDSVEVVKQTFKTNNWVSIVKNGVYGYVPNSLIFSFADTTLKEDFEDLFIGSTGYAVHLLKNLLEMYFNEAIENEGVFDETIENKVKLFESNNGLTVDGVVNKNDWLTLTNITNQTQGEYKQYPKFKLKPISTPLKYDVNVDEVKLHKLGVKLVNITEQILIKMSVLVTYKDESIKVFEKVFEVPSSDTEIDVTPYSFSEAFLPKEDTNVPVSKAEVIIFQEDAGCLKWVLDFNQI